MWLTIETECLKKNYGEKPIEYMAKLIGKSKQAIKVKAMRLGLKMYVKGRDNKGKFLKGYEPRSKGIPLTNETKLKIGFSNSKGEKIVKLSNASWLYHKLKKKHTSCTLCKSNKYLDIHHIDKNRRNNSVKNLIILCRSCHRRVHTNKMKLYFEAVK